MWIQINDIIPVGIELYSNLNLRKWSHDVEILYRAKLSKNVLVGECNVGWTNVDGLKLVGDGSGGRWRKLMRTIQVSVRMLWDIVGMRIRYLLGVWKIFSPHDL